MNDTNEVTLLYRRSDDPQSMNRQWVSVLSVLALLVLAAPSSGVAPPASNASNNSTLGASISSFVQVSSVEAEAEVDREMFSAALANAPNDSARQRLLERRAGELSRRLDSVRRSVETADRGEGSQQAVERSVADARVDALERSVGDVGESANRADVSPSGLDQLREDVRGLREPPAHPPLDAGTEVDLGRPGAGTPGNGTGVPGNGTGVTDNDTGVAGNDNRTPGPPGDGVDTSEPANGDGPPGQSDRPNRSGPSNRSERAGGSGSPDSRERPNGSTEGESRTLSPGNGDPPGATERGNDDAASGNSGASGSGGASATNGGANSANAENATNPARDGPPDETSPNASGTPGPAAALVGGDRAASTERFSPSRSAVTVLPVYD